MATSDLLPQGRPLLLAALRVVPAAAVMLLLARPRLPARTVQIALAIGSFNMGLFFAAFFVAADRLPNGIAATVSNTTPLFVLALVPLVLGERPPRSQLVAGPMALVGVGLLVRAAPAGLDAVGLLCGLASAALLALGVTCTRRWLLGVRPIDAVAVQLVAGAVVLVALELAFDGGGVRVDGGLIAGTALLSVVLTAVPYVLLFAGIGRLGPTRVALLAPVTPVVATVLGLVFRDERLTPGQGVGLVLVLFAIVLAQWRSRAARRLDTVSRVA